MMFPDRSGGERRGRERRGRARAALLLGACALAACAEAATVETAWCDEMLESDMMARALRGEAAGEAVAQARAHCVLVPAGTAFTVLEEAENAFGQTYLKAEVVRPDTGETAALWVRKAAAGIE
jgi:hypothetical protein